MEISGDIPLAKHKANCFRGLVRVRLNCLQFDHQLFLNKHREESPQNVYRLQKIFEKTGCLRLQDENVIDAVVEDHCLNTALRAVGLPAEALLKIRSPVDAPTLELRELKCLNGLHRIRAAERFLDENDKWWIVRLFSNETPTPVLCHIMESYVNEKKPSDGEIFRRIRLYHRDNKVEAEKKWWTRLDNSKPKDLRQLFKRSELISGFDNLLEMPGLWAKVQLGALHRLLTLKCDEEMAHYLSRILEVWKKILTCRNTTIPFSAVDAVTVESLELLAPRNSPIDKALVMDLLKRNVIFPSQPDNQIRQELAENICNSEGLIPSLWTFFETLKYIEPICETLKKLLGSNMKRTIRSSFIACYFPPERKNIQISRFREAEITTSSEREAAWISYVELWAFCGRYFNKLTSFTPRKETGGEKPGIEGPNPVLWQYLASLSISRGFKSKLAQQLATSDPYTELAKEFLRKSSPLSSLSSEKQVQEIVQASRTIDDDSRQEKSIVSGHIEKERRSGRPYENDLRVDEQHLYLPNIYNNNEPMEANWALVRWDIFNSLFGKLVVNHNDVQHPVFRYDATTDTDRMDLEPGDLRTSNEVQDLSTEIESLRQEHNNLVSQHESVQIRNEELKAEKLELQQRYQSSEDQRNRNRDLISSLTSDIQNLKQYNVQLEAEKLGFQQKCQSFEDGKNKDRSYTSALEYKIKDLQTRNNRLEAEKLDLQKRCESFQEQEKRAKDIESFNQRLRLENDTLKENIRELQATGKQNDQESNKSQALILHLQRDKERLEVERNAAQNNFRMLMNENQEHTRSLKAITDERNALILQRDLAVAQTVPTEPDGEDLKLGFLDDLKQSEFHYPWRNSPGDAYEIFLAASNDETGVPKGTITQISKDELEALPIIVALIAAAKEHFGQELRAINIQGKYLSNISPTFVFTACTIHRTIIISVATVLERYLSTNACQNVVKAITAGSSSLEQRHVIQEAEGIKKRRLDDLEN